VRQALQGALRGIATASVQQARPVSDPAARDVANDAAMRLCVTG